MLDYKRDYLVQESCHIGLTVDAYYSYCRGARARIILRSGLTQAEQVACMLVLTEIHNFVTGNSFYRGLDSLQIPFKLGTTLQNVKEYIMETIV